MATSARDDHATMSATESVIAPEPNRQCVWIVSFGPLGISSTGYLVRVEANARTLASLGFAVHILEISQRSHQTVVWPNIEAHPAWPRITPEARILGGIDLLVEMRVQVALVAGLIRYWKKIRSADVVLVESGLLALAFVSKIFHRRRPSLFVYDLMSWESLVHRDRNGVCTFQCRFRRFVWRLLEPLCFRFSDVVVTCRVEDAALFRHGRVEVVPHTVLTDVSLGGSQEDPKLVAFVGSGRVEPNRDAVDFIASSMLDQPGLEAVRCKVIGELEGYSRAQNSRMEFVGFRSDLSEELSDVSVCCAPMRGTGGGSSKVLACLMNGKRTVTTSESARGISQPPYGLWIVERDNFASAVASALAFPWSPAKANALRDWMAEHHGLPMLSEAWSRALDSSALPTDEVGAVSGSHQL